MWQFMVEIFCQKCTNKLFLKIKNKSIKFKKYIYELIRVNKKWLQNYSKMYPMLNRWHFLLFKK